MKRTVFNYIVAAAIVVAFYALIALIVAPGCTPAPVPRPNPCPCPKPPKKPCPGPCPCPKLESDLKTDLSDMPPPPFDDPKYPPPPIAPESVQTIDIPVEVIVAPIPPKTSKAVPKSTSYYTPQYTPCRRGRR